MNHLAQMRASLLNAVDDAEAEYAAHGTADNAEMLSLVRRALARVELQIERNKGATDGR